jgi:hypothetical protein
MYLFMNKFLIFHQERSSRNAIRLLTGPFSVQNSPLLFNCFGLLGKQTIDLSKIFVNLVSTRRYVLNEVLLVIG